MKICSEKMSFCSKKMSPAFAMLVLLLAMCLTACGASASSRTEETTAAYNPNYYAGTDAAAEVYAEGSYAVDDAAALAYAGSGMSTGIGYKSGSGSGSSAVSEEELAGNNLSGETSSARKLIRTYDVNLETEKFDACLEKIKAQVAACGGYIENSSEYRGDYYATSNRNANLCVRIPADRVQAFLDTGFEDAYISSMSESTEDITLRYSDLETKLTVLETERDRLLELLEKAEDVESLIALEERLSEVRYELESLHSSLKQYDNQVEYSTVWIYLNEVKRIEPGEEAGFFEKLKNGFVSGAESFVNFCGEFVLWVVSNIFGIALVCGIAVLVVVLIRKCRKKKAEKKAAEKTAGAEVKES